MFVFDLNLLKMNNYSEVGSTSYKMLLAHCKQTKPRPINVQNVKLQEAM